MPFRDANRRVAEKHRDVLNRHAVLEQRHGERVTEPVGVRALDLRQLESRIEISRPIRTGCLRPRAAAREEALAIALKLPNVSIAAGGSGTYTAVPVSCKYRNFLTLNFELGTWNFGGEGGIRSDRFPSFQQFRRKLKRQKLQNYSKSGVQVQNRYSKRGRVVWRPSGTLA